MKDWTLSPGRIEALNVQGRPCRCQGNSRPRETAWISCGVAALAYDVRLVRAGQMVLEASSMGFDTSVSSLSERIAGGKDIQARNAPAAL